jgi:predicted small secreted protein
MPKLASFSMIKKLTLVAITGVVLAACANTMEGVGKDLQTMGNSMGGAKPANPNPNPNNQSQTQGKDVVVTPVK